MNFINESKDVFPFFDFIKTDEIKSFIATIESHYESELVSSTLTLEEEQEGAYFFLNLQSPWR